jgi:hypothetical protein
MNRMEMSLPCDSFQKNSFFTIPILFLLLKTLAVNYYSTLFSLLFNLRISMRSLILLPLFVCAVFGQDLSTNISVDMADTQSIREAISVKNALYDRQFKLMKLHKTFAFTTGGLLLAADGMGLYHFLSMMKQGHDFRDANGFDEDNINNNPEVANEIKTIWRKNQSQTERIIHASLISAATVCYTTTATIELCMPSINNDPSYQRKVTIHRASFITHAALMAANIGLGMAESSALSKGSHNAVIGLGITHTVVGFLAPVIMFGSGLIFSF